MIIAIMFLVLIGLVLLLRNIRKTDFEKNWLLIKDIHPQIDSRLLRLAYERRTISTMYTYKFVLVYVNPLDSADLKFYTSNTEEEIERIVMTETRYDLMAFVKDHVCVPFKLTVTKVLSGDQIPTITVGTDTVSSYQFGNKGTDPAEDLERV